MTKVGIGFLAGSALFFSAASSAQAAPASVYLSGTTLRHIATDGQTNVVNISNSGSRVTVKDTAGLEAGEGCTQTNSTTVSCEVPNTFVLDLKDGNDIVNNNSNVRIFAYGGPGNDVLNGGSANEGLFGDDGDDVVNGNGGSDFLNGGYGNDVVSGGDGDDRVDDNGGDDTLSGGAGNDTITDNGGRDTISGDAGNDTIYATDEGKDVINCGAGQDSTRTDPVDLRSSCETILN